LQRQAIMVCICGHAETEHGLTGRCGVPGCVCERFEPVPEIAAGAAVSGWRAAAIPAEEARRPHLWQERDIPKLQAQVH
jgi:hypothetical protein